MSSKPLVTRCYRGPLTSALLSPLPAPNKGGALTFGGEPDTSAVLSTSVQRPTSHQVPTRATCPRPCLAGKGELSNPRWVLVEVTCCKYRSTARPSTMPHRGYLLTASYIVTTPPHRVGLQPGFAWPLVICAAWRETWPPEV